MTKKPFGVRILWGQAPEPADRPRAYSFETLAELNAFMRGIREMDGWAGYRVMSVKDDGGKWA